MKKHLLSTLALLTCTTVMAQEAPADMQLSATEWCQQIKAGWNLGNSLESSPSGTNTESLDITWKAEYDTNAETAWGNPKTSKELIDAVKAAGFNAVRIPVRWSWHIKDPNTMEISQDWLTRVKEVVDYCIQNDMYVILNTHHDKWLESQPVSNKRDQNNNKLKSLWTNIAKYFADYDEHLAFAGTNEVHIKDNWGAPTQENLTVQNSYNDTFVKAVRATGGKNKYRQLIIQTYVCNPSFGLDNKLVIPQDPTANRLSVEFHFYAPYNYCNTDKNIYYYWGKKYKDMGKDVCPDGDEEYLNDFFDNVARQWYNKGLGVVIGEYGVTDHYTTAEKDQMRECAQYYYETYMTYARKHGFAAFVWDNGTRGTGSGNEKFGIFNRSDKTVFLQHVVDGIMAGAKATYEATPDKPDTPGTGGDASKLVGEKIWTFDKAGQQITFSGNKEAAFWYMAGDGSRNKWNEGWWNASAQYPPADVDGGICFDNDGNVTHYNNIEDANPNASAKFSLSADGKVINIPISAMLGVGGGADVRASADDTYDIIEMTDTQLVLYCKKTVKGDSGWTWVLKSVAKTTALNDVNAGSVIGTVYNINGQKQDLRPGLNIVNGKVIYGK